MAAQPSYSAFRSAFFVRSISVLAFVLSGFTPHAVYAALVPEKHLQHPELIAFGPLLWKNEGLLFADILLQKILLPFGLTSPYTNLFITEAVRDIAANIAAVKAESGPRRLRARRLQADEETAKDTLRSFVRSLHAALRGNTFDISFADEVIKHLPAGISGQIASITDAFGKEILRVLAEADNPASAIVTHLLGPLDGGGMPVFDLGRTEDTSGEGRAASRRLLQLQQSDSGQGDMEQHIEWTPAEDDPKAEKLNKQMSPLSARDDEYNEEIDVTQNRSGAVKADALQE